MELKETQQTQTVDIYLKANQLDKNLQPNPRREQKIMAAIARHNPLPMLAEQPNITPQEESKYNQWIQDTKNQPQKRNEEYVHTLSLYKLPIVEKETDPTRPVNLHKQFEGTDGTHGRMRMILSLLATDTFQETNRIEDIVKAIKRYPNAVSYEQAVSKILGAVRYRNPNNEQKIQEYLPIIDNMGDILYGRQWQYLKLMRRLEAEREKSLGRKEQHIQPERKNEKAEQIIRKPVQEPLKQKQNDAEQQQLRQYREVATKLLEDKEVVGFSTENLSEVLNNPENFFNHFFNFLGRGILSSQEQQGTVLELQSSWQKLGQLDKLKTINALLQQMKYLRYHPNSIEKLKTERNELREAGLYMKFRVYVDFPHAGYVQQKQKGSEVAESVTLNLAAPSQTMLNQLSSLKLDAETIAYYQKHGRKAAEYNNRAEREQQLQKLVESKRKDIDELLRNQTIREKLMTTTFDQVLRGTINCEQAVVQNACIAPTRPSDLILQNGAREPLAATPSRVYPDLGTIELASGNVWSWRARWAIRQVEQNVNGERITIFDRDRYIIEHGILNDELNRLAQEKEKTKIKLESGKKTRAKGTINEDALFDRPDRRAFAIFDGVGGSEAGEIASETAKQFIQSELIKIPDDLDANEASKKVEQILLDANEAVKNKAKQTNKDMATTASVVKILNDGTTIIGNVGDSRICVLRNGSNELEHITLDDGAIRSDIPDEKTAIEVQKRVSKARHPSELSGLDGLYITHQGIGMGWLLKKSYEISQCLGSDKITPRMYRTKLKSGDRLIIMSDGIHDNLSDGEIVENLQKNSDSQIATDMLVDNAKKISDRISERDNLRNFIYPRAKPDDQSAIVIKAA